MHVCVCGKYRSTCYKYMCLLQVQEPMSTRTVHMAADPSQGSCKTQKNLDDRLHSCYSYASGMSVEQMDSYPHPQRLLHAQEAEEEMDMNEPCVRTQV